MRIDTGAARRARLAITLLLILTVGGCFSLARSEPPQQHYVLGAEPQEVGRSAGNLEGLAVGVRRLQLAAYLDPPFLVVRRGRNRITYSEYHRWGEPLAGGINRAVASYLSASTPFRGVDVAPWAAREEYDYLIQLHVERFEGMAPEDPSAAEGTTHMLATWEIIRQQDGTALARGSTEHRDVGWVVGDYAGLVRSLDAGLNALSQDLISSLEDLASRSASLRGGGPTPTLAP
jgi:uncharacterized protein